MKECPVHTFHLASPIVSIFPDYREIPNQEIDIGTVHRAYPNFELFYVLICMCLALCSFIICVASYNCHHNQDINFLVL